MVFAVSSLPRDPDILIEMIAGLRAENEKLRAMLETLKRARYGARSE
jgi:transposase